MCIRDRLWLVLHIAVALVLTLAESVDGNAFFPSLGTSVWVLIVVVAGMRLDVVRRKESLILANLGFSPWQVSFLVLGIAGMLEAALRGLASGMS